MSIPPAVVQASENSVAVSLGERLEQAMAENTALTVDARDRPPTPTAEANTVNQEIEKLGIAADGGHAPSGKKQEKTDGRMFGPYPALVEDSDRRGHRQGGPRPGILGSTCIRGTLRASRSSPGACTASTRPR